MKKRYYFILAISLAVFAFYFYPEPTHTIKELYKGEDLSRIASLDSLRSIPLKTIEVDGERWSYLAVGEGKQSILFLHGMAGGYDIWWQEILALKDSFRIVSVTYPPVSSLEKIGEGVLAILDAENIDKTNVIGTSLGGYLAQYLKASSTWRFDKVVFSNTFPPNEIYKAQNASTAFGAGYMPEWMVMALFRSNLRSAVLPASENSPLVEAYLMEQSYGGMSKEQFLARYQSLVDTFIPAPHLRFSRDILIIESDNDPLVFPELRQQMKELYPMAEVFTFHNKGHFPYLNESEQYTSLVRKFLERR